MINENPLEPPKISIRRVVTATLVVAAVALAFWFLWRFHYLVLIFLTALVISIALRPVVQWASERGLPPGVSVALVYLLLLALIVAFVWFGLPLLADQATRIANTVTEGYLSIRQQLISGSNILLRRLALSMPVMLTEAPLPLSSPTDDGGEAAEAVAAMAQTWGLVGTVTRSVLATIAIFLLAFYWTLEAERIKRGLLLLFAIPRREPLRELITEIEYKVGRYVIGQSFLCLIIFGITFPTYLLIGLPYAFVLALFAGLMEAVPLVGPVLGAVPAVVVAFSISPTTVVWVIVASVIIQQLENNLLVPRVMEHSVGVRPLVTLLALLTFGSFFGMLGALIAIPMAATVQLLLDRYVLRLESAEDETNGRGAASVLRYKTRDLVHDLRQQIRQKEDMATAEADQVEDTIEAIALDLDSLIARHAPEEEGEEEST